MKSKNDKGFTLVELLIVIVILGILATVTVFAVRGITDRGQENACAVEGRTLDTAVEAFYATYQRDPILLEELTVGALKSTTGVTTWPTTPVLVDGAAPLLKNPPSAGNWTFSTTGGANFEAVTEALGGKCF